MCTMYMYMYMSSRVHIVPQRTKRVREQRLPERKKILTSEIHVVIIVI